MGEKVCIFAHLYFFLYLCSGRSALSLPIFDRGRKVRATQSTTQVNGLMGVSLWQV